MKLERIFFILIILPFVEDKLYLYNTEDSLSIEFYDCINHQDLFYCRRLVEPIVLQRENNTMECHYGGKVHSFVSLQSNNISVNTILHQWKSTIEKVEEYSRYLKYPNELDGFICECTDSQSFGKNCEYRLPIGTTFKETIDWEVDMKLDNEWEVQMHGDIVCYNTLECDYGLLCLDWREICDGVQQCIFGIDENDCDLIEFNECENDEYRCMNGMCIPQEYFLDGQLDCLDWSDEIQYYIDLSCVMEEVSSLCDDRLCPPNQWSCGDGVCIPDRISFQKLITKDFACVNRRDQYYLCETHATKRMWTLPTGRCYGGFEYEEFRVENRTFDKQCEYILKCLLSEGFEKHCPCNNEFSCIDHIERSCPSELIQYPKGRIITPYTSYYYVNEEMSYMKEIYINGTIKCRGFSININNWYSYHEILNSRSMEDFLCRDTIWAKVVFNNQSYDENCHNLSKTFNKRSYKFIDICNETKECISVYRIKDGIENCLDKIDESIDQEFLNVYSNIQRYRFRCSIDEITYLSVIYIGDGVQNCANNLDELWIGTSRQLSQFNCNSQSTNECNVLRQYIEMSWISTDQNKSNVERQISFDAYCDTFWDIDSRKDENISECRKWWVCRDDQWQCRSGQCINQNWVLDGEWDCSDASDEEGIFDFLISNRNLKVIQFNELEERSNILYKIRPFSMFCNQSKEFGCIPINVSNLSYNSIDNRPCIDFNKIGDGHIDCYGGIDERNTLQHCYTTEMFGHNFMCASTNTCIPYQKLCNGRCSRKLDDVFWCGHQQKSSNCNIFGDFICLNGTHVKNGRCNTIPDCSFAEDEYMCQYTDIVKCRNIPYRDMKIDSKTFVKKNLKLYRFPKNVNVIESMNELILTKQKMPMKIISSELILSLFPYWCNRGIGIEMMNNSIICFCPPQYYGNKCQFQTDRIIVLLHLNLSQSIYTEESDPKIVLKLLVLFMFRDEIILQHEFHIRPAIEIINYEKKMIHFIYSRSLKYLLHKKQRYQNRSNIIDDHPYSIRIETYEIKNNDEFSIIAIWRYPIYFDYLPVFRLAKVLRLTKPNMDKNPCLSNPCNQNQQCYEIVNENSSYICLCKINFGGENCSIRNQLCIDGYCSSKSLCKPDYRGFHKGNKFPYCLCPLNQFGERCEIEYDQCLSNPCQNGGSCFPRSNPNHFLCLCTDQYYGKQCQINKPKIQLNISKTINHIGSVVQYLKIEFISLDLILIDQQVFHTLPTILRYVNDKETLSDMILIKLYFSHDDIQENIYLLSLHIKATSTVGTTEIIEKNQCVNVLTLISNYDPIKYHQLCRNNTKLICFYDKFYICICEEDHSRVECFGYDHNFDICSNCLSGGRCLKGNQFKLNDFICLCPSCYSGRNCQFNSNSFAFTLDQLFFVDLTSIKQKTTICLLIIIPFLLFLIALPNNIFSFITFRRQKCLCNGVGQYLLCMSIINQICLTFLAIRLIHLSVTISGLIYSQPMIENIFCKLFSYSLNCFIRISYWLASLITIERVYSTVYLRGQWLKKPQVARCLIIFIFLFVFLSNGYELVFVKSFSSTNDDKSYSICVVEFPIVHQSMWIIIHQIVSIINSMLPLFLNICCTITIIYIVTKKKMNIHRINNKYAQKIDNASIENLKVIQLNKQQQQNVHCENVQKIMKKTEIHNRFDLLRDVLSDNKELIARPAISLIPSIFSLFSLPLFISSFSLGCRNLEMSPLRYLLIVFYFISFIPQILTFFLYIYPSSLYSNEWRLTEIGKWINNNNNKEHRPTKATTIFSNIKQ